MYSLTIKASTPEELAGIVAKLQGEVSAPVQEYAQLPISRSTYQQPAQQQYQPIGQPVPTAPATSAPVQAPIQPPIQQPYYPPAPPTQAPVAQAVPTAQAPTYTIEQLGVAAGPIVDAGRGGELTAWLQQRGANALTQLDKSHYGEFATYLRGLGAKI